MLGLETIVVMFFLSSVVATISMTVCRSAIFKPLRTYLEELSPFWGGLFKCTYCFSHWVSAIFSFCWIYAINAGGTASFGQFVVAGVTWALVTLSMVCIASGFAYIIRVGHN
jgi:hypothetical protein